MQYEPESEWLRVNSDLFSTCFVLNPELTRRVYVDLGASHPRVKSLTDACRVAGWRGVAIDGNQDYTNDWASHGYGSHFVCAVLSPERTARFAVHENSFTSRISDSHESDHPERWGILRIEERTTVPLEWILTEHSIGEIDLLTIDLEGHEAGVLRTLDFEKHKPKWIISEYVTAGEETDPRVTNFLLERGYEVVQMFPSNIIYRRKN